MESFSGPGFESNILFRVKEKLETVPTIYKTLNRRQQKAEINGN